MQSAIRFVMAAMITLGIGPGACACARAQALEAGATWDEAQSLRELPAGIQALLGVGLGGGDGIADRGDSFNIGDISVDNTPQRRFALGIGNGTTTVVAVEQGGRGYGVQVLEFHQDGKVWAAARCTARPGVPSRGVELLDAFTVPAGAPVAACRMTDGHVSVEMPPAPRPAAGVSPGPHLRVRPRPGA